jgi:hypothetical protein
VFVVLRVARIAESAGTGDLCGDDVVATKAFRSEAAAEREARRLNEENAGFGKYIVRVARMEPDELAD